MKVELERTRYSDGLQTFTLRWALYWWDFAWIAILIGVAVS